MQHMILPILDTVLVAKIDHWYYKVYPYCTKVVIEKQQGKQLKKKLLQAFFFLLPS